MDESRFALALPPTYAWVWRGQGGTPGLGFAGAGEGISYAPAALRELSCGVNKNLRRGHLDGTGTSSLPHNPR